MICIRAIYNLALAANRADRNDYPFGKGKYQIKIPEAKKIQPQGGWKTTF